MAVFGQNENLSAVLDNPAGQMQGELPKTQGEVEQRKGAWSQLLDDPNAKSALFRMGLQMMRGTEPGEGGLAATARAGMDAMDYFAVKNELDRKREREGKKDALEEKRVTADIAQSEASTASTAQSTQQNQVKFDEWKTEAGNRKQKSDLEVQNLIRSGRTEEARLKKAEFEANEAKLRNAFIEANPELRNSSFAAELQLPTAQLNKEKAATNAQNASAAASMESVQTSKDDRTARPAWIKNLPDEEAQLYAMTQKDLKSQEEINADIVNGLHKGISRKNDKTTTTQDGITGMAQALVNEYENLSPAEKDKHPLFDKWVQDVKPTTVGASLGAVLSAAKAMRESRGTSTGTTPPPLETWLPAARKANPRFTDQQLQEFYNKKYGITKE